MYYIFMFFLFCFICLNYLGSGASQEQTKNKSYLIGTRFPWFHLRGTDSSKVSLEFAALFENGWVKALDIIRC